MSARSSVEITIARIAHETVDAMLVETQDGREVWLPFSQVDKIERRPGNGIVKILVADWLARKEDLA